MKSAFANAVAAFALTAALLQLNLLPGAWEASAAADQAGFEERHAHENKAQLEAQLGLGEV